VCKGAAVPRFVRRVAVLGALALLFAACSSGGDGNVSKRAPATSSSATTATSAPATTGTGGALRISPAPWKLPSPSSREVALTDGTSLVVLGGLDASRQTTGNVVRVDPSNGASQALGSLTQAVHDAAGAFVNGAYIVIAGGTGEEGSASVQSFQAGAGGKVVGSVPGPLSDHVSVTVDGKVYVVGGFDGHQISPNVLVGDDGTHYRILGALAEPVRYPAAAASGGAIYVFGGVVNATGSDTRSIQRIDPATGQTTVVGQLPAPLSHASAVEIGGQVYVLGGFVSNQVTGQVLRFDPRAGTVTPAGTLPAPVTDAAVTTIGGTAYLVGGQGTDRAPVTTVVELTTG
jgi:N-acetylneuraminic acid mutarotase